MADLQSGTKRANEAARLNENPYRKNPIVHGRPNARSASARYSGTPVRARVFPEPRELPADRAHPSIPILRPHQRACLDALAEAVAPAAVVHDTNGFPNPVPVWGRTWPAEAARITAGALAN